MKENELHTIEAESAQLLTQLRQERDRENALITPVPPMTFDEPSLTPRHNRSPWWMAAAVAFGFVVGLSMPRGIIHSPSAKSHLASDTVHSRSVADGDLNTALLVSI